MLLQLLVLLWGAVLYQPAWAQTSSPEPTGEGAVPVNTMCPVMVDERIDPRFTAEYEGATIGFCCRKCLTRFEQEPAAYVANLPVSFNQEHAAQDHHAHVAHERTESSGVDREEHDHDQSDADSLTSNGTVGEHTDAANEHDHAHSHDTESRARLAVWIGKFHPPATHLPIGLLVGAAIAELGMIATKRQFFRHAAGFWLVVAAFGAVAAATLGWFNGGFVLWDNDWVQATHRWLGTGAAAMTLVTVASFTRTLGAQPSGRTVFVYHVCVFMTTSLVSVAGFFGGALVYGINHYAW